MQRLNTETLECETIKLLSFAPRCLVAGNGWLCCGSESGEFAAIRLDENDDENNDNDNNDIEIDADSDARPSFGIDPSREDSIFSLLARARRSNKSLLARCQKLAKDRVNCITLWFPPTTLPACDEAYDEAVAVLANNDRTVTLVSVQDFEVKEKAVPLEVITYPDFVNRAIISPDGKLLIAILDDPYLYVHERVHRRPEALSSGGGRDDEMRWEQTQRILLKSQRKDDRSDSRGSFAACFSNSGAYLAVGTQHGTISIFKTDLLTDPEANALVTTFRSSRPQSGPGAVRDMSFCPGPFDILAWTEDRGHVGIADMRSNYVVRQIVNINSEPDYEHISILDRNTIDPRLLEGRTRERRETGATSTLGSSEGRRRGTEGTDSVNPPLTANETMVLEAIQGDRRRRDRLRVLEDRQGTSTSPGGAINWQTGQTRRTDDRTGFGNRSMAEILTNYRDQRERAQERVRSARQLLRDAANDRQQTRRSEQRLMDTLGETVAAMRDQRERPDPSYLTVLEILQARERNTNDREQDDSLLVPLVNQVVTRWEESAIRGTLAPDHGVFEVPPSPDNTAGLAWSEDGRTL